MKDLSPWRSLSSAIVSDMLDQVGRKAQLFDRAIRPILDKPLLVGRARTLQFGPGTAEGDRDDMLEAYFGFLDSLQEGDVPVIACGLPNRYGIWGDVLSTAAQMRGAEGCVTDGFARDILQIKEMGFSLYCSSAGPQDPGGRAKIVAADVAVSCGGTWVEPGDLIFGDFDGCLAVPQDIEEITLSMGQAALAKDEETLALVRSGKLLREVYKVTGVF